MLSIKSSLNRRIVLLTIALCAFAATAFAQDKAPKNYNEFCSEYNNYGDKISVSEARELVLDFGFV